MPPTDTRFYIAGGTLPSDARSYVERACSLASSARKRAPALDRDLLAALHQGEYCYVLNSRQMGKSSLCVRAIARLREEGPRTVFLDLTKFGGRNLTAEQWYAALLATIYHVLSIDPTLTFYDRQGRPLPILPTGQAIRKLI